jgi:hypothetical protein
MTKRISKQKLLPTIWRTPDELWEKIKPILAEYDPPKSTGRSRAICDELEPRGIMDAWTLTQKICEGR